MENETKKAEENMTRMLCRNYEDLGFNDACLLIYDLMKEGKINEPIDVLNLMLIK